jgi:SAM-dependent methyltransferase
MIRKAVKSAYTHLWLLPKFHRTYRTLSVAETFRDIYRTKKWGDNGTPFYSGAGSHGPASEQYCAVVTKFIRDNQIQSVVDLGCGDFAIGNRIVEGTRVRYTGIDVVPELIEYHQRTVRNARASFQCADITKDPAPAADLCLVRQVLQHLSNDEIMKVLTNLRKFPWVLISEDVLRHPRSFNRDKPHGPDVRAYFGSGVFVDRPPFSMTSTQGWEFSLTENTLLRTVLIDQGESRQREECAAGQSA